jgi:hypothetical protein
MINVMAKKETTKKKATTKKATKKLEEQAPIEVQEFEEAAALEVVEPQEEAAPAEVEVMNGDPAVVTPVEEPAAPMAVDEPESEDEELPDAAEPVEVEPVKEEAPAPQEKIKPKNSVFRRMFGYIWNGQEMDY